MNVTLAVDDALRTQYNASGAGLQYEALPDSTYTFDVKTGTIKAGSRLDTLYVHLLTDKLDFTHNYMLPVKDCRCIRTNYQWQLWGCIFTHYWKSTGRKL